MAEIESVQAIPQGLLEILGMKGSGINPRSLDSVLQGVIDVRQMYALNVVSTQSALAAAAVPINTATVTVPPNENWVLLSAVATLVAADGASSLVLAGVGMGFGAAATPILCTTKNLIRGAGALFSIGSTLAVPFFPPYPVLIRGGGSVFAQYIHSQPTTSSWSVSIVANVGVLS